MKAALNRCYILHPRAYLESSVLLDIFSREHGRLSLIARGGRREKSKFAGLLQPYQGLLMAWQGRGELKTLTDVETERRPHALSQARLIAGFYINELLVRLLHRREAHHALFDAYERALAALTDHGPTEATLRTFEKKLLDALGYGLSLERDVGDGEHIEADRAYHYLLESGPLKAAPRGAACIPISGATLRALAKEHFDGEPQLREAKRLMRWVLRHYLGDKPLASQALYRDYLARAAAR